jgi:hypothetical protein
VFGHRRRAVLSISSKRPGARALAGTEFRTRRDFRRLTSAYGAVSDNLRPRVPARRETVFLSKTNQHGQVVPLRAACSWEPEGLSVSLLSSSQWLMLVTVSR